MTWPTFMVDFNILGFGPVVDAEDWAALVDTAEESWSLHGSGGRALPLMLAAKMGPIVAGCPTFGDRAEHCGRVTLEEWALSRCIDLRAIAGGDV